MLCLVRVRQAYLGEGLYAIQLHSFYETCLNHVYVTVYQSAQIYVQVHVTRDRL